MTINHRPLDPKATETPELARHRDSLYTRLETGYERIERVIAAGDSPKAWENFWIDLLREYERVCDELTHRAREDL